MSQKIEMILSVKDAQMVAAWKRGQQSVAAFNQELDRVGTKQRRNKKQSGQFFKGMNTGLTSMVGGYISVAGAAGILMDKNREILTQTEEVGKKFDEIFRKLRVQSGLRGIKGEEAQKRVLEIAERQAFESQQASGASTQLVSSGFSAKEATGGSLEEFLRILNASNVNGKELDPAELAKSLASYLQSQGLEKNEKNVALVGRKVQALFKGTNMQLGDLAELSKVSSIFKDALSIEEQLGGMSTLVDQIPAAEAKTGFRNFVLRLSTITEDQKPKTEALDRLGLKKEDVDFVGENFNEVLDRLAGGVQNLPEEDRRGVLNQIFGEKTIAAAQILINDRQKIKDSFPIQNNTKGFLSDVDEATTGRNAAERRQKVRLERRRFEQDDQGDLLKSELDELAEKEGVSRFRQALFSGGFNIARYFGADAETAASIGYGGPADFFSDETIADRAKRGLKKRLEPASTIGTGVPDPAPPPKPGFLDPLLKSKVVRTFTGEIPGPNANQFNRDAKRFFNKMDSKLFGTKPNVPARLEPPAIEPQQTPIQDQPERPTNPQPAPELQKDAQQPAPVTVVQPGLEQHTKALEANTEALNRQANQRPSPQKPVKVEVRTTVDTSTVPNGTRASAALARPAK